MHNKGLFLDALSALCKLYLVISIRDMRSLPHSSVGFGMKYPYHEQNQTFWVSKIAADLSDFATKELNPRFWLTGNKRDTTILIRLALNNKVTEWERRWKLSTQGLLSIANLLLIRDASMHNKQSGEKKEQPRTTLFLGELKQTLGSSIRTKSFIMVVSHQLPYLHSYPSSKWRILLCSGSIANFHVCLPKISLKHVT